ncbi:MAG: ProQ/FINO family protein [Proteobacteria bacterium]|nr:ProQ/FINO family protein [Pseudomonadota bacterium]
MSIDKFLSTEAGAKALKAKLKAMPEHEKAKPSYAVLWKKACEAVNQFNLDKMKKELRDGAIKKDVPKDSVTATESTQKKGKDDIAEAPVKAKANASPKNNDTKPKAKKYYPQPEIIEAIATLETKHPALFNLDHPKPVKIGIDKEIKETLGWDDGLVKEVMRYYVTREKYNYNFLNASNRYDLDGKATDEVIGEEQRENAKQRLNYAVGRFDMEKRYPDLMVPFPRLSEPFITKSGLTLYYSENLREEINRICKDCYGVEAKIKKKGAQNTDGSYSLVVRVIKNDEVLHEVNTIRDSKQLATRRCYFKLHMRLMHDIKAYSFDYDVPEHKKK